ncbi:RNA polymerase sigma factor [Kocuria sp. TGY1127_2]|uniref:RNA polymerase sigma factor n=1 Tax=Kocuria sp. TGY1127_2 TaxID=2711328 RepID=UPI0015B93C16|nr:sigma-70 family RNA polymerase sigma factor [Kocuria sp. TGY1127_2]
MSQGENDSSAQIATLVLRAQDGDVDSFERLVDKYQAPLLRLAFRMLGNRADAEDVAQESLMNAWLKLEYLETPEAFSTWLYRQAVNRCKDILKSPRHGFTVPIDETNDGNPAWTDTNASADPQRQAENQSSMDALSILLQKLPREQRECWVLREQMELSYAEISRTLALPEATVRGRLSRARKTLANEMKEWQ